MNTCNPSLCVKDQRGCHHTQGEGVQQLHCSMRKFCTAMVCVWCPFLTHSLIAQWHLQSQGIEPVGTGMWIAFTLVPKNVLTPSPLHR
mmetsp:Transcript_33177/g.59389  ORF Transcript_33177/g.59389 Transcript_33177/m.59389 type:complete len:88 (+) Transcript_33177:4151-4414(+)